MFMGLECAESAGLHGAGMGSRSGHKKSSVVFELVNVAAVFIHNPPILINSLDFCPVAAVVNQRAVEGSAGGPEWGGIDPYNTHPPILLGILFKPKTSSTALGGLSDPRNREAHG